MVSVVEVKTCVNEYLRVLDLYSIDMLNFACTTKRVCTALRQADVLDLAFMLQLLQDLL